MNYKTYAEAKIANPDCEIVTTGKKWNGCNSFAGVFQKINDGGKCDIGDGSWVICNPADYCSSLKEFFDAGFELARGDLVVMLSGIADNVRSVSAMNNRDFNDYKRYILSAAALNGGCKMPDKAEQWSVYNNTLPLCELTDERYGKMRRVHEAGAVVEFASITNGFKFEVIERPSWCKGQVYRIKLKSERDLFIDAAINHGIKPETQNPKQIFGELFDSGKFKYIDNTQHFGENI